MVVYVSGRSFLVLSVSENAGFRMTRMRENLEISIDTRTTEQCHPRNAELFGGVFVDVFQSSVITQRRTVAPSIVDFKKPKAKAQVRLVALSNRLVS